MDLRSIGWDEFFQEKLEALDTADTIVGRVVRAGGDHLGVLTEDGEMTARIPGKMKDPRGGHTIPGIGDWVLVKPVELGNVIIKTLDRKNHISRKVAGKEFREQLVGANIDLIFIVMGLDKDYNLRRVERYLFMVAAAKSTAVIVLNKADLEVTGLEEKLEKVRSVASDTPVHAISALGSEGLDQIRQYIGEGVTISVVGSSGAGKSTLINALLGEEKQATGEVREKDSKGKHITSSRELFLIPGGGVMIDNPGIREIQLWGDAESLQAVFTDIDELSKGCKFKDCGHVSEPKCAVKQAVETGALSRKRYENYLKMKKELHYLQQKADMSSEAVEKARWRGVLKDAKHYKRYKEGG